MTSRRGVPFSRVATTGTVPPPPAEPVELDIRHRMRDDTFVVEVAGEVDLDTTPQLRTAVVHCVDQAGDQPCVLDLTAVTFLDSAGLTTLLNATHRAEEHHGLLRIVVDSNRPVIRPIAVTGLDDVLTLYHTIDEAIAAQTR